MDSECQVIVAAEATNQASDKNQAVSMIEQVIGNAGALPKEVSADAGYYSAKAVEGLSALGVDLFIAPDKTRHGQAIPPASRGRIPANLSARDRMRRKLRTKRGRQRYAIRKETVEPVLGQVKQGCGFRQFLLRGLEKVNREWSLICTGHNQLKLFRFGSGLSVKGPRGLPERMALMKHKLPMISRRAGQHLDSLTMPVSRTCQLNQRKSRIPRTGC